MARAENLVGRRFGRLRVLSRDTLRTAAMAYFWCMCICGNRVSARANRLRAGTTTSCGCWTGERISQAVTRHGDSAGGRLTPEYRAWSSLQERCNNPNNKAFKNYGGRGITVCVRWQGPQGYRHFLEDMGRRPSPKHSIDRKNNDGDYAPENCRWATPEEQANNQRGVRKVTYGGKTLSIAQWARHIGVKEDALRQRIKHGWTLERALSK